MIEQINLSPPQSEGDLINDPTIGTGELLASEAEIAEFLGNVKPMSEAEYDQYRQEDGNAAGGMKPYIDRAEILPYPGGTAELMIPQPSPLHGEKPEKAERRVAAHLAESYMSPLNSGQTSLEGERQRQGRNVVITEHGTKETKIPENTPSFLEQRLSLQPVSIEHDSQGQMTSLTYETTNPYDSTIVETHSLKEFENPDGTKDMQKHISLVRHQRNRGPDVV